MQLPYPTITQSNPFLYFTVQDFNLKSLANNVGTTQLLVCRKQKKWGQAMLGPSVYPSPYPWPTPAIPASAMPIYYTPLEQTTGQRFTFVMDNQLFTQPQGRYVAILQYNGMWVGRMEFIYSNPQPALTPDNPYGV